MKYKKILITSGIYCCLISSIALAALPEKSDTTSIPPRDKTENNTLSVQEFNQILGTLRGIFNWNKSGQTQIGINDSTPDEDLTLDVDGKIGAEYFCDERGESCIKAGKWTVSGDSTKPTPSQGESKTETSQAAECQIRYRVKVGSRVSDWVETGGNRIPEGPWITFNNTEKEVCADRGCGIQMGIKCQKAEKNPNPTSCQARYRLFNPNNTATDSGWVTTPRSEEIAWQDGEWLEFQDWKNWWWQTGLQCQSEETTCRLSYKTRDEKYDSDWVTTTLTQNKIWADGSAQHLESDRDRPCDGILGCGIKLRLHCTEKDHVPKIPIYLCPREKSANCTSTCQGQLSADPTCVLTKNQGEEYCSATETKNCSPLGHLVR